MGVTINNEEIGGVLGYLIAVPIIIFTFLTVIVTFLFVILVLLLPFLIVGGFIWLLTILL